MAITEKAKGKVKKQDGLNTKEGTLFQEVMNNAPQYESTEDAIAAMNRRLMTLATKHNVSVEKLLLAAEDSSEFSEDHLQALALARRLNKLKK
jgi:hypothetical protein